MNLSEKWVSILAFVGIKASADASGKIQMQQDELDKIHSSLEASKGYLEAKEKAEADLVAATKAAADAKTALDAAVKANEETVAALNTRITELGGKPGGTITALPGTSDPKTEVAVFQGMPEYVNTNQSIYKLLASMG